jgi:hypothetical protein
MVTAVQVPPAQVAVQVAPGSLALETAFMDRCAWKKDKRELTHRMLLSQIMKKEVYRRICRQHITT